MNSLNSAIPNVSSEVFSSKFITALNVFYEALTPMILPVAKIGFVVFVLVIILGSITCSKRIKEVGWGGIATVIFAVVFYYLIPLILGLLNNIQGNLKL